MIRFLAPFLLVNAPLIAGDPNAWPQFRGPGGRGVAVGEQKLLAEFGPSDNVVWKTPLPEGVSSPCISKDHIFLTGFDPKSKKLETICLDRARGEILWRRHTTPKKIERVHRISSPASSTPAIDGPRVYVYFGSYGLLCYDFQGKEIWNRPLPVPNLPFGTGSSPIVVGDRVLLNVDQQGDSYLLAVDCRNGQTVWKKERLSFQRGWCTPVHIRHNGTDRVIVLGGQRLVAYNVADGSEAWWMTGMPPYPITTPVVAGDRVYLAVSDEFGDPENVVQPPPFATFAAKHDKDKDGFLHRKEIPDDFIVLSRHASDDAGDVALNGWFFRSVDKDKDGKLSRKEWDALVDRMKKWPTEFNVQVLAIRGGGRGDVTKTHVIWRQDQGVPEVPSPLHYRGRVYTVKNGGILYCRDAATGKLLHRGRLGAAGGYYASPVAGDGKLYVASDRGAVIVVKADDRFEVLARNNLGEPIMATPALADGKVYVRTQGHLYAFGE